MPETVEEENIVDKLDSLSDSEVTERGEKRLERFKQKLREYSSE